jgi:hypothetical protein
MTKPVGERRQDSRVMFAGDGLRDLDLFPKDLFVVELFDERARSLSGVDGRLRRLAGCDKNDDIVIAFGQRNATGRGVALM